MISCKYQLPAHSLIVCSIRHALSFVPFGLIREIRAIRLNSLFRKSRVLLYYFCCSGKIGAPISDASASLSSSLKSMNVGFSAVQGVQPKPV